MRYPKGTLTTSSCLFLHNIVTVRSDDGYSQLAIEFSGDIIDFGGDDDNNRN
jgi:hypothetical protein